MPYAGPINARSTPPMLTATETAGRLYANLNYNEADTFYLPGGPAPVRPEPPPPAASATGPAAHPAERQHVATGDGGVKPPDAGAHGMPGPA